MWPFVRVVVRRFLAVRRISKICKDKEINFKILNHRYLFSSNNNDKFDFILRIEKTIIPVKFFSATDRRSTIILSQSGMLCIRKKIREPIGKDGNKSFRVVDKQGNFPSMRIEKKIIGDKMKCFPVFLNEPPFESVMLYDKTGNLSDFYDGFEKVAGCNFVDFSTFRELLIYIYKYEIVYFSLFAV